MISKKDWKAFQGYRNKVDKEIRESEEYSKTLEEIIAEQCRPIIPNGDRWDYLNELFVQNLRIDDLNLKLKLLLNNVPDETVEACLNWLTKKK